MRRIGLILPLVVSVAASAQLPQVQLPVQVPALPGVERAVGSTLRELAGVRALRAERLLRANRATLDRDPRGDVIVRAEVVAVDITPAALDKALAAKFRVLRTQDFADLGVRLTVLQTPEGMSATRGLKRLRKLDPQGVYDYNHVYFDSGDEPPGAASPTTAAAAPAATGSALSGRSSELRLPCSATNGANVSW